MFLNWKTLFKFFILLIILISGIFLYAYFISKNLKQIPLLERQIKEREDQIEILQEQIKDLMEQQIKYQKEIAQLKKKKEQIKPEIEKMKTSELVEEFKKRGFNCYEK